MSSYLPDNGWRGYGSPSHPYTGKWQRFGSLRATVVVRRQRSLAEWQAIHRDNAGHFLREYAFAKWLESTVYGQAVNRWIARIGAEVRS